MAKQKIRIRLKAFDHRLIDRSTKEIVEQPKEQVLRSVDLFRCPQIKSVLLF